MGAGSVPSDSVWQDHPETQDEARHRERCEKWADQLFKTSEWGDVEGGGRLLRVRAEGPSWETVHEKSLTSID